MPYSIEPPHKLKKSIIKKQKGTLKTLTEKRRELHNEGEKAKKRFAR